MFCKLNSSDFDILVSIGRTFIYFLMKRNNIEKAIFAYLSSLPNEIVLAMVTDSLVFELLVNVTCL